jgi:hypothetical protein
LFPAPTRAAPAPHRGDARSGPGKTGLVDRSLAGALAPMKRRAGSSDTLTVEEVHGKNVRASSLPRDGHEPGEARLTFMKEQPCRTQQR